MTRSFIAGGAGFIGSHLTDALLRRPDDEVVVYNNLASGSEAHLEGVLWKGDVPIVGARLALRAHIRRSPDRLDRCQHRRGAERGEAMRTSATVQGHAARVA